MFCLRQQHDKFLFKTSLADNRGIAREIGIPYITDAEK